ncbi:MAG: hypothetical protein QGH45_20260 [Myxococcota bacterium]|jgi:hypothetical protein|nr:hypothetical protein [Myxococcota bacterium]
MTMRWFLTMISLAAVLALGACDFIPPAGDDDDDDDSVPDEPVLANGDFEEA